MIEKISPHGIKSEDFKEAYESATRKNGLIPLMQELRNKEKDIAIDTLNSCFSHPHWVDVKGPSGHRKIKNKITHVIIEYQNHGNASVATHIRKQVIDQLQTHLNILGDDIFKYKERNWKTLPNCEEALKNYEAYESAKNCAKKTAKA